MRAATKMREKAEGQTDKNFHIIFGPPGPLESFYVNCLKIRTFHRRKCHQNMKFSVQRITFKVDWKNIRTITTVDPS